VSGLAVTDVRFCMRGSPEGGVWYEGRAEIREPDPGWPGMLRHISPVSCGCRHGDGEAARKCAARAARTWIAARQQA
jgi:hypothetical protein